MCVCVCVILIRFTFFRINYTLLLLYSSFLSHLRQFIINNHILQALLLAICNRAVTPPEILELELHFKYSIQGSHIEDLLFQKYCLQLSANI